MRADAGASGGGAEGRTRAAVRLLAAEPFRPHPLLANGHAQTLARWAWPRTHRVPPDGARLFEVETGVRLLGRCRWHEDRADRLTVLLVHGLGGSADAPYVLGAARSAHLVGANVVRLNQRNCGGTEGLTPTLYHSGMSQDLAAVVRELVASDGLSRVLVAGFSMGGNLALKMAGEMGGGAPAALLGVCAVSPALDLEATVKNLGRPSNRPYQWNFVRGLRRLVERKKRLYPGLYDTRRLDRLRTVRDFDELYTAPHGGFDDAGDYYVRSSALPLVPRIRVPTLIVHARDDPLVPCEPLLHPGAAENPYVAKATPPMAATSPSSRPGREGVSGRRTASRISAGSSTIHPAVERALSGIGLGLKPPAWPTRAFLWRGSCGRWYACPANARGRDQGMNGAESLARTLTGAGVEVCFANPGTSEMHFVAALDRVEGLRCVLGLAEGVVTGAADGYGRMAEKPASTLLHLGPGLANGLANVHNARRASTPMVNVVGDHATYHKEYDAPLASDVEGVARPFSHWVRTSTDSRSVAGDGAEAVAAALAPPGRISTLILPADASWNEADGPAPAQPVEERAAAAPAAISAAARVLRSGELAVLFLGGAALREPGLTLAGRVAASTGARLIAQTHNARVERGAGRIAVDFLPYPVDEALAALDGTGHLLLVGAKAPVAFFAYPGKPSELSPPQCEVHTLATPAENVVGALEALAEELDARQKAPVQTRETPSPGGGTLDAAAAAVGAMLPEGAVVVDEALTGASAFLSRTRGAAPHDLLQITGGAIGIGLPLATGAAIAAPERKVVCLQADGSAMYTVQALWTQAREGLDVTTVILDNRSYAILKGELANVGAGDAGRRAHDIMELDRPALDWVALARGMGVEAGRATTVEEFNRQLEAGLRSEGPYLIDLLL